MNNKITKSGRKPLENSKKKSAVIRVRLREDEIDKIKCLFDQSSHSNFSALIRDVLLKKSIKVEIQNLEVSNLIRNLTTIKGHCSLITKNQVNDDESKLLMEEIRKLLIETKESIESFKKPVLHLEDLIEQRD